MKKRFLPALLLFCLLLTACGGTKALEERYQRFSADLNGRESLSFEAGLRAEYEDRTVEFRLRYALDKEGCTVTVLEPELIAGISARMTAEGAALGFEGVSVDTGPLDGYGLTPLSALPLLVQTLKTGHLESCWEEEDTAVLELIHDDRLSALVRFRGDVPVGAELVSEGVVKVVCEIENWE